MRIQQLTEQPRRVAAVAFGRMNPPTIGHAKLVDAVKSQAGDPYIFLSQSQKPKTDPLSFEQKIGFAKAFFPGVTVGDPEVRTIFDALNKIYAMGYTDLVYVAGSDRVQQFTDLINKYNGQEDFYSFDSIQVVSAGERDPDAEGAEGMSASKMRAAAVAGDFEAFKSGTPNPDMAQSMYDAVRTGMGMMESLARIIEVASRLRQLHEVKPLTENVKRAFGIVLEAWSEKYKRSINCNNPKGFSQRAHCQGRKKNEDLAETIRKTGSQYTVYSKKGKRMGTYPSKKKAKERLRQIEYFKHVGESKEGSYLLQLERDDDLLVLHIKNTQTGQRTEVRGKPNYEGDGYDATDPLHQLLDKVGKAANISELMNGEVVSINPSHPQGPQARATVKDIAGESQLNERATDIVYHYTTIGPALNILKSGEFQLSSVAGSVEQDINPKGHNFFLSTARSKGGEYHSRVGNSAVMFVLNGRWISDRYPVKPVDYWSGFPIAGRNKEAEDRIFSKDPTMPMDPVTSIHVLLKEKHPFASAKTRQFLILAKTLGIPTYLYKDESAWRLQNTAKAASVEQMKSELSGPEKFSSGGSGSRWLKPWLEVIFGKTEADLGKKAKELVRSFRWYHRPSEPGSTRGDDHGLGNELSNARKPGNLDREDAVKILKFMRQNRMATHMDLVNYLVDKWKVKDESIVEAGVGRITKQNATKDAPIGSEFANVKKLGLGSGKPKELHAKARKNSDPNTLFNLGLTEGQLNEKGSIGIPLSSGMTVVIAPHRPLKVKKGTPGKMRYEDIVSEIKTIDLDNTGYIGEIKRLWNSVKDRSQAVGKIADYDVYLYEVKTQKIVFLVDPVEKTPVGSVELKKSGKSYYVDMLAFLPQAQGKGLATKLYEFIVTKLKIMIRSGDFQSPGSQKLYAKLAQNPNVVVYGVRKGVRGFKYTKLEPDEISGRLSGTFDVYDAEAREEYDTIESELDSISVLLNKEYSKENPDKAEISRLNKLYNKLERELEKVDDEELQAADSFIIIAPKGRAKVREAEDHSDGTYAAVYMKPHRPLKVKKSKKKVKMVGAGGE